MSAIDLPAPGTGQPRGQAIVYPDLPLPRGRRTAPSPSSYRDGSVREERNALWLTLGAGAVLGAVGAAWYAQRQNEQQRFQRPPDSAPLRTSRVQPDRSRPLTGRTVTIGKPRAEVYAFWRDFSNIPRFLEHVESIQSTGDGTHRWTIETGSGREIVMDTRIVHDVENEEVVWRTVEGSDIESEGRVLFRDAPGDRGTEVVATAHYHQPGGALGGAVAKLLQVDPKTQIRRGLKRLKMLMETGEISTAANRVADAARP